jgi:dTDP-4-amino-4,6-dideoxygalactose transaminase
MTARDPAGTPARPPVPAAGRRPDCSDPPLDLGLGRADPAGGALALLAGRRAALTWNTRVAIRAGVDVLGLKPGDEVLAPAWYCGSELDPLRHAGLAVTLCPVGPDGTVDPAALAPLIGPRTRAIYLTHYMGVLQPHRAGIRALADAAGLKVIEDCALSLLSGPAPAAGGTAAGGTGVGRTAVGETGDIAVFCFYKFFAVLAGGALVVNDPALALPDFPRPPPGRAVLRAVLRAGLARLPGGPALRRWRRGRAAGAEDPAEAAAGALPAMPAGYRFDPGLAGRRMARMTARALAAADVAAAVAARHDNHARLLAALGGVPGLAALGLAPLWPVLPPGTVPLAAALQVTDPPGPAARARRDALVAALQAEGIAATPWWAGYNRAFDHADRPGADLAAARALKDRVLALPVHQYLGPGAPGHMAARLAALAAG